MIIEFELVGSQMLHKGVFDATGFWAKFDVEQCDVTKEVLSYKIYSHFSFTFEHVDKSVALNVFDGLVGALSGVDFEYSNIGFIRGAY